MADNDITENVKGIYMATSRFSLICGNNITESDIGIELSDSDNGTIYHDDFNT